MAVSEDGGPDSQVPQMTDGPAGISLAGNPAQAGDTKRHAPRDQEPAPGSVRAAASRPEYVRGHEKVPVCGQV